MCYKFYALWLGLMLNNVIRGSEKAMRTAVVQNMVAESSDLRHAVNCSLVHIKIKKKKQMKLFSKSIREVQNLSH